MKAVQVRLYPSGSQFEHYSVPSYALFLSLAFAIAMDRQYVLGVTGAGSLARRLDSDA